MRTEKPPKVGAFADLRAFLATRSRVQIWAAVGSVTLTLVVVVAFLVESRYGYLPPDPKLIYAQSWDDNRSAEDVYAARKQEAEELARAEAEAKRLEAEAAAKAKAQPQATPTK
jgi:hypothetical protein